MIDPEKVKPGTQNEIIRDAVLRREGVAVAIMPTDAEIAAHVREVRPRSRIMPDHVRVIRHRLGDGGGDVVRSAEITAARSRLAEQALADQTAAYFEHLQGLRDG